MKDYVMYNGLVEIGRIFTFGCANRRDIIRRLMACSDSFKRLTFADAFAAYRYAETNGLIHTGDGWLAIYHDAN